MPSTSHLSAKEREQLQEEAKDTAKALQQSLSEARPDTHSETKWATLSPEEKWESLYAVDRVQVLQALEHALAYRQHRREATVTYHPRDRAEAIEGQIEHAADGLYQHGDHDTPARISLHHDTALQTNLFTSLRVLFEEQRHAVQYSEVIKHRSGIPSNYSLVSDNQIRTWENCFDNRPTTPPLSKEAEDAYRKDPLELDANRDALARTKSLRFALRELTAERAKEATNERIKELQEAVQKEAREQEQEEELTREIGR